MLQFIIRLYLIINIFLVSMQIRTQTLFNIAKNQEAYKTTDHMLKAYTANSNLSSGNIYHVAGSTGNDDNDGSENKPFKTIGKAIQYSRAGVTIILHRGIYREQINLTTSGTADNYITIEGAAGDEVIIKGSDIIKGWKKHSDTIWIMENWLTNSQQVFQDGIPLVQIGSNINTIDWGKETNKSGTPLWMNYLCPIGINENDLFEGSFYLDETSHILYLCPYKNQNPNEVTTEVSTRLAGVRPADFNVSYYCLRNLVFMHNTYSGYHAHRGGAGVVTVRGMGWIIDRCTMQYADISGLHINGGRHCILNSRMNYNGAEGFTVNGGIPEGAQYLPGDILFYNCEIIGNNIRGFSYNHEAGGNKLAVSTRTVIKNCTFLYNRGPGIWYDVDNSDFTVLNCLVSGNMNGIHIEISRGTGLIAGNIVIKNDNQGIYISGSAGNTIIHNFVYDNQWGIVIHGMPRMRPTLEKTYISANDKYNLTAEAAYLKKDNIYLMPLYDNVCLYNIVYKNKRTQTVLYTGEGAKNNIVKENWYYFDGMINPLSFTNAGYAPNFNSVRELNSALGFEKNSIEKDPLMQINGIIPLLNAQSPVYNTKCFAENLNDIYYNPEISKKRNACWGPWQSDTCIGSGITTYKTIEKKNIPFEPRPIAGKKGEIKKEQDSFYLLAKEKFKNQK
ncbi:MAG: hypothetical protein A2096_15015 [Spirochaetes bacterium GWF1_41_5]|nr:MAG: hypothetical protein A2096_15015 [Spirochaetes bacterium GWF1_41_5]